VLGLFCHYKKSSLLGFIYGDSSSSKTATGVRLGSALRRKTIWTENSRNWSWFCCQKTLV